MLIVVSMENVVPVVIKLGASDDNISEFNTNIKSDNSEDHSISQTLVSQVCLTVYNKYNNNKSLDITCDKENDSLPTIIGITNSVITSSVEPATLIDINTNKVNAESETVEDHINNINTIFTNETLLEFVFLSIEKLEVMPENYLVLESYLNFYY